MKKLSLTSSFVQSSVNVSTLATIRHAIERSTTATEQLPGSRKAVLAVLSLAALPSTSCYPSQRAVADRTGFSVRTVRRSLRDLEEHFGLETRHGQRYQTNTYELATVLEQARARAGLESRIAQGGSFCRLPRQRVCSRWGRKGVAPAPIVPGYCAAAGRLCRAGACCGARAWGVQRCTEQVSQGPVVAAVRAGSRAEAIGLRPGDRLHAIEGLTVRSDREARAYVETLGRVTAKSRSLRLVVVRAGRKLEGLVTLPRYAAAPLGISLEKNREDTLSSKGSNLSEGFRKNPSERASSHSSSPHPETEKTAPRPERATSGPPKRE